MLMSEAGRCFEIEKDYHVLLPEGDHLILVVGAPLGSAAASFEHPNVAAKVGKIFEYKHYRASGSKFWTSQAGVETYFVVPKKNILLIKEKGYSYVKCQIGDTPFFLNVSGGGGSGWTDNVNLVSHTGVTSKKSLMKVFAANAILPYDFEYKVPSADVGSKWKELVSRVVIDLAVGMKVSVENDNTYVLTSVNGRRKCCIGKDLQGFPWRIKYSQINWFETAELNGIFVPDPIYFSKFKELAVAI